MGCGQSHIAVIYPRKAKGKPASGSGGSDDSDEEAGRGDTGAGEQGGPEAAPAPQEDDQQLANNKLRQMVQISSSPLLAQAELSTSQYDFFKMLDEKINNGPDYQPNCDFEFAIEESRLSRLLDEWQSAKQRAVWGRHGGSATLPGTAKKLQRYHSLQSNGDLRQKQLHHQVSQGHYHYQPQYQPVAAYYQHYQPPPPPPAHIQYQYQYRYQYPPPPPPHQYKYHQYQLSNSVVMYDKARGGYYTELA